MTMEWKPVSEYTTQEPGTLLLLWESAPNMPSIMPMLFDVEPKLRNNVFLASVEKEGRLPTGTEISLSAYDREHITHFAVISPPEVQA